MFRSAQDGHDAHLRTLLDQRSARVDTQGRYSTASELSDTPSVYSRHNFSPRPSDQADQYSYASPISPTHSRFTRDYAHDQSTSMLEFEDTLRSPFPRTGDGSDEDEGSDEATQEGPGETDSTSRMSYLGPKMRFHSRAPWEMEDDPLDEEDEPEDSSRNFPRNYPFARTNGDPQSSIFSTSSPRPSYTASRPSGESSILPKRSFETVSSQVSHPKGALYALAQESLSSNNLTRPPGRPKEKLRNKFSLSRIRPDAPTEPLPPSPAYTRLASPSRGTEKQQSHSFKPSNHSNTTTLYANKNYNESNKEIMHPYANPDLVVSYVDDQLPQPSPRTNTKHYPRPPNEFESLIHESYSAESMTKSSSRTTLTPDTSVSSTMSRQRTSSALLKNISSPVPVVSPLQHIDVPTSDNREDQATNPHPDVTSLPGWTERHVSPGFSLISLEEARAQRMRSSTFNVPSRMSTSSGLSNSSAPFPSGETESTNVSHTAESLNLGNLTSRARGRSISAGAAKAKNAMQNIVGHPKAERRESEQEDQLMPSILPPGKALKPKKSGFLRLFNAKALDKEDLSTVIPPVPSLPETMAKTQQPLKAQKSSVHRIPVPSLPSSLLETTTFPSDDPQLAIEYSREKHNINSPRRTPPTLTINTLPANSSRSSTSAVDDRYTHVDDLNTLSRPWLNDQPQSAPANVSEFPTLRLRPISTLFSAHFGDHIVLDDSRSSAETTDVDTPSSPSPAGFTSPVTPGSSTLASNDKRTLTLGAIAEDQTSNQEQAFQEQMHVARKAWQRQIWELEGQVRDLKAELAETKGKHGDEYCQTCGRGTKKSSPSSVPASIVNRPRARTGTTSRFVNALP